MSDFSSFKFGNYHSSDLHLQVVSSSDRFVKNTQPQGQDYTLSVPGGDGAYYFGQTFGTREFSISVAFDSIDEPTWRRISQIFTNDKPQDLIFDENPYKVYKAKCNGKPEFKYVCFRDKETGKRIYKGEGTINFICYHPYAFCFNKYIVRAADFYKFNTPQNIIEDKTIERSKYNPQIQPKKITGLIKDHYNTSQNMGTPWKGGYPTIEQVQWGQLFFTLNGEDMPEKAKDCATLDSDRPESDTVSLIDVRGYWDNVPKWAEASKLLTTPTLDFDQELIYLPQYNRTEYYNMEIGINKLNSLIGSRLLVYNPGDIPVNFTLQLGNLSSNFRGINDHESKYYTFRVSRFNVQRLTLEQAVDWTGMRTRETWDENDYKYGTKYFTIVEGVNENKEPKYKSLNLSHPNHCYVVEPIPAESLGHFIRLFYWQSNLLFNNMLAASHFDDNDEFCSNDIYLDINRHILNHEEGEQYATRYEELRDMCVTDEERYELYWNTLKKAILNKYKEIDNALKLGWFTQGDYSFEDFVHDFIHKPSEYIRYDTTLNYGEFNFNISRLPQFMTFDYFDINSKDFDTIPHADCGCTKNEERENHHREQILPLYLDSDKRLLYSMDKPKWENNSTWEKNNQEKLKNFYDYKPKKIVFNDNIERGHWFQIPPGWSLIDVSPLMDEKVWGGKRWLDARPFDWGSTDEDFRNIYNEIYRTAAINYLAKKCPDNILNKYIDQPVYMRGEDTPSDPGKEREGWLAYEKEIDRDTIKNIFDQRCEFFDKFAIESLEEYLQFRLWYDNPQYNDLEEWEDTLNLQYECAGGSNDASDKNKPDNAQLNLLQLFGYELLQQRRENAEIGFLKTIADYWRFNKRAGNTDILEQSAWSANDIDDWWWYANNYIWHNFPPLYWGYVDLLNRAEIKYIPQYY